MKSTLGSADECARPVTQNVEVTDAMTDHAQAKLGVPLDKFASVLSDDKGAELHMRV